MFCLTGYTYGFPWKVQGVKAVDGRVFAVVNVGSITKRTESFRDEQAAHDAGCQLMADTLAQLADAD